MEFLEYFGPVSLILAAGSIVALIGIKLRKSK